MQTKYRYKWFGYFLVGLALIVGSFLALSLYFLPYPQPNASIDLDVSSVDPAGLSTTQINYIHEQIFLTNQYRVQNGRSPLKLNQKLVNCAMWHVRDQQQNNYYNHTDSRGRAPWDRCFDFGYPSRSVAENIFQGPNSPQSAFNGWKNSQVHRDNILLTSARDIGVGYLNSGGQHYWTVDFGLRGEFFPIVINLESQETSTRNVTLYFHGNNAGQIRVRNEDGDWANWQPYTKQKSWQLSAGDGIKKVLYQYKINGITYSTNDTIKLVGTGSGNTTPPAPNPPVTPPPSSSSNSTEALFRFYKPTTAGHLYTNRIQERNKVRDEEPFKTLYDYEGEKNRVFPRQLNTADSQLAKVYRAYNFKSGTHRYTINTNLYNQMNNDNSNWDGEGHKFHAFKQAGSGREPFYEFYNTSTQGYFYTSKEREKNKVRNTLPQFNYVGISFYVLPKQ